MAADSHLGRDTSRVEELTNLIRNPTCGIEMNDIAIKTLFILLTIAGTSNAHGGRLDSRGGHHDRKNGGYHFHPERQRPTPRAIRKAPVGRRAPARRPVDRVTPKPPPRPTRVAPKRAAPIDAPNLTMKKGQTIHAKVVSVHDGDTFTVMTTSIHSRGTIRLAAIDAPEMKQNFGVEARDHLKKVLLGKQVRLRCMDTDRNDRIVAIAKIEGADLLLNKQLVAEGMAWHFVEKSKSKSLAGAQREAKRLKRGLWADEQPIEPWKWVKSSPRTMGND